jgi:hypothetical protein
VPASTSLLFQAVASSDERLWYIHITASSPSTNCLIPGCQELAWKLRAQAHEMSH